MTTKHAQGYSAPMKVIKTASGAYRWYGISSVNAIDRDREIVSEQALARDVYRSKVYGDESVLAVFHIVDDDNPTPFRIGGAPDYRALVDGHLIESGEFDDTPLGRGFAKFFMEHPESTDGGGWGISIGFLGTPDPHGVFYDVQIKERSVLPLNDAANPFTSFGVNAKQERQEETMPLNAKQIEFLRTAETMMGDPEVVEAVNLLRAAQSQSKSLTESGVQRKAASDTVTLSGAAPVVPILSAGTFTAQPISETLGFNVKATKDVAEVATAAAALDLASTAIAQAQTAVATVAASEGTEESTGMEEVATETMPTETAMSDTMKADAVPSSDAPAADTPPAATTSTTLSDADLQQIAAFVDQRVAQALDAMKAEMATATKAIKDSLVEVQKDTLVKAYNAEPVLSIAERLHKFSAAHAKSTTIDTNHPLYAEQGKNFGDDPNLDPDSQLMSRLGFK